MSNFGKRMSNRKTGTEKLKRDANKIKSKESLYLAGGASNSKILPQLISSILNIKDCAKFNFSI